MRLSWAAVTDPGLVRQRNEDSVLAEAGIYAVADGMGGHSAGDVASEITVDILREASAAESADLGSAIPQAIKRANSKIRFVAGDRVMGSTVTGLALSRFSGQAGWLVWNVGDSRCYRISSGEIEQITTDHTLVAEMLAAGDLSTEAAAAHPDRHIITRAVGADEDVEADYWLLSPSAGEQFVLCSDGLTNELSDPEILAAVTAADSPAAAAIALLSAALERGGSDNVSAIVVFCEAVEAAPDAERTTPRSLGAETAEAAQTAPRALIADAPSAGGTASAGDREPGGPTADGEQAARAAPAALIIDAPAHSVDPGLPPTTRPIIISEVPT